MRARPWSCLKCWSWANMEAAELACWCAGRNTWPAMPTVRATNKTITNQGCPQGRVTWGKGWGMSSASKLLGRSWEDGRMGCCGSVAAMGRFPFPQSARAKLLFSLSVALGRSFAGVGKVLQSVETVQPGGGLGNFVVVATLYPSSCPDNNQGFQGICLVIVGKAFCPCNSLWFLF